MPSDLARYFYAACFAKAEGVSLEQSDLAGNTDTFGCHMIAKQLQGRLR